MRTSQANGRMLLTILAMALCLSDAAHAQSASDHSAETERARRVPVTIAVVDSVAYGSARAVILRRAHGDERDLILIPRANATGEQLSAAIFMLLTERELAGDSSRVDQVTRVTSARGPKAWTNHETAQCDQFIRRLLGKRLNQVPGIGRARSGRLYLLPHAFKGKLRRNS